MMVAFYARRIDYNLDRLDEVPRLWRAKVKKYIEDHPELQPE